MARRRLLFCVTAAEAAAYDTSPKKVRLGDRVGRGVFRYATYVAGTSIAVAPLSPQKLAWVGAFAAMTLF